MVTLNLTDTQAVILDALFRNHSTEEDIDLVKKEFKKFLKNDAHDPLTCAYAIVANDTPDWIFLNDDGELYNSLEDIVYNIGLAHQDKAIEILNNITKEISNGNT